MGERAENFERSSGRSLPATYRTFINAYDGGPRARDAELGLEFRLSTAEELLAPYTLDGTAITRPFFSAHILHLARLRDSGVLIFDGGSTGVSPERFESMNTIGVGASASAWEQNQPPTHLLVLDPADGSLRCVPIDPPAVVRKVADSFARWVKAAMRKPRKATSKKSTAAQAQAKPKKAPKPPTPATILAAFKRKNKLTLPLPYAKFLKAHDGNATFPGPGGEPWSLATLAELADPATGTAQTPEGPVPAFRLTRVYADAIKNESGANSVPVYGSKKKFTLARLRKGLCVGHCNGDPMFLDPTTKYSVWGYCREGKYVGKLADTFALFLKPKVKKVTTRKTSTRKTTARKPTVKKTAAKRSTAELAAAELPTPVIMAVGPTTPTPTPAAKKAVTKKAVRTATKPAAKATKPEAMAARPAAKATKPPAKATKPRAARKSAPLAATHAVPPAPKKAA
jgi:hypothetical protein